MTATTSAPPADHRRGWLVILDHAPDDPRRGLLGAGETISSARADAHERCEIAGSAVPAPALVIPCSLAELDTALVVLRERPRVGRLTRHAFTALNQRHYRIMGDDVPAANRADVRTAIPIGWDPTEPRSNLHGRPLFPRCPDCTHLAILPTGPNPDPARATLECSSCGSLYRATGLHTPAENPPRPGPEDVALMRRQAAEMCESAAAHLRRLRNRDDARAQALVVDARRTIQKLRARLAIHVGATTPDTTPTDR